MTLKFDFFYRNANTHYFLGLLQKVANAHSVVIRVQFGDEILSVFASGSGESLGAFANALEVEIPLSLYFRFKSAEMCEKPLGKKIEQNLSGIFSVSEINAIKNPSDLKFCEIFGDSTESSLRGKAEAIHKNQKIDDCFATFTNPMDCHDLPKANLAMTSGDSSLRGESMDSPKQSTNSANHDSTIAKSRNDEFMRLDSHNSLKPALESLCDLLIQGQNIALSTSKGAILLSTNSDDFDFILANDISTISLYTRASVDELNAIASFEKPLIDLAIKEVFVLEIGAKNALFILPYDIILCCISSILLNRGIAFVRGKMIDSANPHLRYDLGEKSDFFEIVVGQNGYFLKKNFLEKRVDFSAFLELNFGKLSESNADSNALQNLCIIYLSSQNPSFISHSRIKIAFDKNPKNILQKISTLENGDKLIANFKKAFEARYEAIQSLDSAPQWTQNLLDIFECAAMILGREADKNAIFNLAQNYLRDIGPKIDFKNVRNSSLGASFALGENFERSQTPSLVSRPKFSPNTKLPPQNTRIVDLDSSNSNESQNFCDSKNDKNNPRVSATTKSVVWGGGGSCEGGGGERLRNSQESPHSSPHPLPQEKRALNNMEFDADLSAESRKKIDSRFALDSSDLDSSATLSPQNDKSFMDCFDNSIESPHNDKAKSPQDEFDLIYDESRTIRSIISFTLAGSESEVIAFGAVESLVDYLILALREAQSKFCIKSVGIIGDIFANKVFFDKITKKIPKDLNLVFPKYLDMK